MKELSLVTTPGQTPLIMFVISLYLKIASPSCFAHVLSLSCVAPSDLVATPFQSAHSAAQFFVFLLNYSLLNANCLNNLD